MPGGKEGQVYVHTYLRLSNPTKATGSAGETGSRDAMRLCLRPRTGSRDVTVTGAAAVICKLGGGRGIHASRGIFRGVNRPRERQTDRADTERLDYGGVGQGWGR